MANKNTVAITKKSVYYVFRVYFRMKRYFIDLYRH